MIYYKNHDEDGLPIKDKLAEIGVVPDEIPEESTADGILGIVHDTDLRTTILDQGKKPLWLRNNGIILFVSSGGITCQPERRYISSCKRHCYVFGISRKSKSVEGVTQFLLSAEWREIIEWAKTSADKESVESLKESSNNLVKELLWPDDVDRRNQVALAILCQGYLFCFHQHERKGKKLGDDVEAAFRVMKLREHSQKEAMARGKEVRLMWKSVQVSTWWLSVFRAGSAGKVLTRDDRANAIKVIRNVVQNTGTHLRDSERLSKMLENGQVDDANIVARVFLRLKKELA